jgi:hypothetical protein
VSAEELAAALYHDDYLSPADLADDEHVWSFAAAAIVQDGLNTIERRTAAIQAAEAAGTVANPDWLALCRRRVAEVTGCAPAGQATTTRRAGCTAAKHIPPGPAPLTRRQPHPRQAAARDWRSPGC